MKRRESTLFLPRTARRLTLSAALTLGLALVTAGCGGGGDGADRDAAMPSPPPSVSATIGPTGGTLVGPDDVRVEVPAGALAQATTITVTRSSAGAPALPSSAASAPAMYEFTPHGLQFAVPVTISMASALDPAIDPVFMAQPAETWVRADATAANGRVSWTSTHFSWSYQYPCSATYPPGTPIPPNGPEGCQFPSAGVVVTAVPANALTPGLPDQYRVSAEADVTVSFRYSAPLDCLNPTIRTARVRAPEYINPVTLPKTPVSLIRTPVADAAGAFRLNGSTDVTFHFSHVDNGVNPTGFFFACQGGIFAGGGVLFTVQITPPPAAPAAPAISAQPASLGVAAGATATFDVLASAPDNLVVRWERREPTGTAFVAVVGAAPITGGSRLTAVAAVADSGAAYRAQVCNAIGGMETCITSSIGTLTVTVPPTTPIRSTGLLSGANSANCAISADRRVLCWGNNLDLALGTGVTDLKGPVPAQVVGLTEASFVSSGVATGCAVHGGGKLACWGTFSPDASTGTLTPIELPVSDAVKVYADNGTVCWIRTDKRAYCNAFAGAMVADGQAIENVVEITRQNQDFCLLDGVGTLRCLTDDGNGRLTTTLTEPGVKALGRSATFTPTVCGVLAAGTVKCWGLDDRYGQFGRSNFDTGAISGTPAGVADAIAVSVGARHACALIVDGSVMCWGTGLMGNGQPFEQFAAPTVVQGLAAIVDIATGFDLTCALRNDGQVLCWGPNESGQLGNGTISGPVLAPMPTVAGAVFAR